MKLSQREQLNGVSLIPDLIHVVREGVSWKRTAGEFLKTPYIPWRYTSGNWDVIIFKFDKTTANFSTPENNDIILCFDKTAKRIIIAMALGSFEATTVNLEDNTKFIRFYDGNALL